ncbi:hypothetical protein HBDW_29380 [Herbaspirillum sp. DW155]|uniref:hypothetical protein n=1 Tax=Herbaspirillum sp. DW155 TaxID=3095609 RepID=UPI0030864C6B|nr:hypothetical protein HBDW_29380 [Herbaspirillum sp. DW155]
MASQIRGVTPKSGSWGALLEINIDCLVSTNPLAGLVNKFADFGFKPFPLKGGCTDVRAQRAFEFAETDGVANVFGNDFAELKPTIWQAIDIRRQFDPFGHQGL